jgi:hypothetical protein
MNLISYSLTCINWVLSCICEDLTNHVSRIFVALFEMMPSKFIYACLSWYRSLYACGDLLNLLIHFISYISSWLFACYLVMVSLWGFILVFASLGIMVAYNCLNTCLYILWSTLILISCIAPHSSLSLCLMSSLSKGERLYKKLVELLLTRWLREETLCSSEGVWFWAFLYSFFGFVTFHTTCWFCDFSFF